ncbi:MAG: DUF4007 family protein [Candidatus Hadarchaeum sp.]
MIDSLHKLQLTKGFYVDLSQIARMLAYSVQWDRPSRMPAREFAGGIGVSPSRVLSLASLGVAFGLLRPIVLTASRLGMVIHRHDAYLDDLGTLWLMHYVIGSNERHVVWNRLVNRVIPENQRLSTAIARPYFDDLAQFYSERTMDKHLRKELSAVWNAYTEQAFAHLDYLRAESEQIYVHGDRAPIPPLIFLAAVLLYRERHAPNAATIDIPVLASGANSPGRVFGITQRQVRDLLDAARARGGIYVESRADLDQVRLPPDRSFLDTVRQYYEER